MRRRCLILFTKPARPGRVKTRLIGALSAEQAAELHEAFLADVCARLLGGSFELRLAWALEPDQELPREPYAGAPAIDAVVQSGPDLGARLYQALADAGRAAELVAAVGSDHPELEPATVEEAFTHLEDGADVVLGPAVDGGYYLIALRREALAEELFSGIAWSTETVLAETLERCRRRYLRVELLAPGHDVDRPADLERLAARLRGGAGLCPRTHALLTAWGWFHEQEVEARG